MDMTTQSTAGADYQVTRLQYYLTRITVIHDGGQTTAIPDATLALVNAEDETSTTLPLGNINVTNIEGVKFHIGVWSPMNNDDPSLWPMGHPLAPQSPSMHWGWASGYRFLVYEGKGGANFSQVFQMHGLGNSNYWETTVMSSAIDDNGTKVIAVNADYVRGVDNIQVNNGVISHGDNGDAKRALENFRDFVFTPSTTLVGVNEVSTVAWDVYPNPSSTDQSVVVALPKSNSTTELVVSNIMGQQISRTIASGENRVELNIETAGIYFVSLMNDGIVVATKRIIKQ